MGDYRETHRTKGKVFIGCQVDKDLQVAIDNVCETNTIELRKIYPNAKPYSKSDCVRDCVIKYLKEQNAYNQPYVNIKEEK